MSLTGKRRLLSAPGTSSAASSGKLCVRLPVCPLCVWRLTHPLHIAITQAVNIDKKDVNKIEYMIRRTKRQLDVLAMPTVNGLQISSASLAV